MLFRAQSFYHLLLLAESDYYRHQDENLCSNSNIANAFSWKEVLFNYLYLV